MSDLVENIENMDVNAIRDKADKDMLENVSEQLESRSARMHAQDWERSFLKPHYFCEKISQSFVDSGTKRRENIKLKSGDVTKRLVIK